MKSKYHNVLLIQEQTDFIFSEPILSFIKETELLYKVLSKYTTDQTTHVVMSDSLQEMANVFEDYCKNLEFKSNDEKTMTITEFYQMEQKFKNYPNFYALKSIQMKMNNATVK